MSVPNQKSLRERVFKAGTWSFAGVGASLIIRFGSNLIMTRLLIPEMFGVMAMATTVMIGLAMFSDVGLKQNIVQSTRGDNPKFLNTAWTIQILRGLLLWLIAVFLSFSFYILAHEGALPAESVYSASELPFVTAALSFSAVISGFESTKQFQASRTLSIDSVIKIDVVAQTFGFCCMITLAYFNRSVWALVAGSIGSSLLRLALTHICLKGVPNRLFWDRAASREILLFGKWIFTSSILGFLVSSGDRLLLGAMVNSTELGFYSIATLVVFSVEGLLSKIMSEVSFPAFSEVVRDRPHDLKKNYYRFHSIIALAAYSSAGFLVACGQPLVGLLYDHRYEPVGWMVQILATILLTMPFRLSIQSYLAQGMPKLLTKLLVVRLISLIVLASLGFMFFGLVGAIWGIALSQFADVPIIVSRNVKNRMFDLRREISLLFFILVGYGLGMLAATIIQSRT